MNFMLIFNGENPTYMISQKKSNFNVGLYSDIYRRSSFKLGMIRETTKLYIFISMWMTLTFIQGHRSVRNQKLRCTFSIFKHLF